MFFKQEINSDLVLLGIPIPKPNVINEYAKLLEENDEIDYSDVYKKFKI
jgi:hypothetical protein